MANQRVLTNTMNNQNLTVGELHQRIRELERLNADLTTKNAHYRQALREVETTIVEQVKSNALRELIDDISHDLRSPLSTLTTHIYLLKQEDEQADKSYYLDVMDKQVSYLTDIINNLINMVRLDMRITQFELHSVQINEILRTIIETVAAEAERKDQLISTDFDGELPEILVDRVKITRALMNFVQNAIAYTPERGMICLSTSYDRDEKAVLIEIADTGIGISEEDIPRIFDRFYRVNKARTEAGSSGLGLSIAKKIIDEHVGWIEVESEIDTGTIFRVYLPTATL